MGVCDCKAICHELGSQTYHKVQPTGWVQCGWDPNQVAYGFMHHQSFWFSFYGFIYFSQHKLMLKKLKLVFEERIMLQVWIHIWKNVYHIVEKAYHMIMWYGDAYHMMHIRSYIMWCANNHDITHLSGVIFKN